MSPTAIIAAISATLIVVLAGFGYWQYERASALTERLSASQAARLADQKTAAAVNEQNLRAIADLREQAAEDNAELQRVNGRLNDIGAANQVMRNRINKWRDRLEAETFKRPAVVARSARRSVNSVMRRIACVTDAQCRPSPDGSPAPASAVAPEDGKPGGAGIRADDAGHSAGQAGKD